MSDLPFNPVQPPNQYSGSADLMLGDKVWHCNFASYQIHRDPNSHLFYWGGVIIIQARLPDDPLATYRIVFDNGASGEIPLNGIMTYGQRQTIPIKGKSELVMVPTKPKRRQRKRTLHQ